MNKELLASAREMVKGGDSECRFALAYLIKEADSALDVEPFSVMDKISIPPSGDKHDYMSMGPYWWPDPIKVDGLPYIQRDGEKNPESQVAGSDFLRMEKMTEMVEILALAYYFTGGQSYAGHAARLLRTWFIDPDTRMNPHLKYGQAIPGKVEGRGIGIIDTVRLLNVIDAAELLQDSDAWLPADHQALRQWFGDYLEWLITSPHGRDEERQHNNHGTWYDAQVVGFALFVDDRQTARRIFELSVPKRLAAHLSPEGLQPHELARTLSFDYSCFNLEAIFKLAQFGEQLGVDLWYFQLAGRDVIRAALDYLAPYADPSKCWPHPQIMERDRTRLLPLLRQGYLVYGETEYLKSLEAFPEAERQNDISQLLYPTMTA